MELRVLKEREEILMNSCELSTLDSFVLNKLDISVFSEERNYWLLRTQGGTYFDEFYFNNYIGIEWDDIVDNTIKSMETMAQIVSQKYPEEKRATYVAGQIWKFIHDFKKGDIVLIPNKDSKIIAFGEIVSSVATVSTVLTSFDTLLSIPLLFAKIFSLKISISSVSLFPRAV